MPLSPLFFPYRKKRYAGKGSSMENGLISTNPFVKDSDFAFVNSKPSTPSNGPKANGTVGESALFKYQRSMPSVTELEAKGSVGNGSLPSRGAGTSSTSVPSSNTSGSLPKREVTSLRSWPAATGQNGYIADLTNLQVQYIDPTTEAAEDSPRSTTNEHIYQTIGNTNNNNAVPDPPKPRTVPPHTKGAAPNPPTSQAALNTQEKDSFSKPPQKESAPNTPHRQATPSPTDSVTSTKDTTSSTEVLFTRL